MQTDNQFCWTDSSHTMVCIEFYQVIFLLCYFVLAMNESRLLGIRYFSVLFFVWVHIACSYRGMLATLRWCARQSGTMRGRSLKWPNDSLVMSEIVILIDMIKISNWSHWLCCWMILKCKQSNKSISSWNFIFILFKWIEQFKLRLNWKEWGNRRIIRKNALHLTESQHEYCWYRKQSLHLGNSVQSYFACSLLKFETAI